MNNILFIETYFLENLKKKKAKTYKFLALITTFNTINFLPLCKTVCKALYTIL